MLGIKDKKDRGIFKGAPLLKGLFFDPSPEVIPDEALLSEDSFIEFQGLLRKDWNIIKYTGISADNITYYAKGQLPVCEAPSEPGTSSSPPTPGYEVEEYE